MWILGFFLFHLVIYSAIRLQFILWNLKSFQSLNASDMVLALVHGLRFDAATIAMTTGLWILLLILFAGSRWIKWLSFLFFTAVNLIFILVNCADIELINFTARRFTKSSLFLVGEGGVSNLITPYAWLAFFTLVICTIYVIGCVWFSFKVRTLSYGSHWLKKSILVFCVLVFGVILARGGLQHKPLTFMDSHLFESTMANNMVMNSTFTFLKSYGKSTLERIHFFDQDEMLSLLNTKKPSQFLVSQKAKPNIVLFIVESLSKEYFELNNPERTPVLRELAGKGYYFPYFYANSRRSIEGIASILAGIPALMDEPFINSEYAANDFIGLGTVLNQNGYETSFFHGAKNGSMHFDRFTKSAGITYYFGQNEYPNSMDTDGAWGVYDEPFFKWTCEKLSGFKAPFFTTIFSLTSHQPFQIPAKYQQRFTEDPNHPILKAIEYTDFSIGEFINCAKSKPWFEDTIFIFTADHTGPSLKTNPSFAENYQIPLIIYMQPHHELFEAFSKINTTQYAQHIDLLPTLLETLQIPQKNRSYLGRSLWQSGDKIILLYSDRRYELLGDVKDSEKQLKAVRQYFSEGLFDNRLYYPVSR